MAAAVWALKARRRWCLSGTPLQNSVEDLFSYFRFLRFAPYDDLGAFRSMVRDARGGCGADAERMRSIHGAGAVTGVDH